MPSAELTNQVVGLFGVVILFATSLWIGLAFFGFVSREKNRRAQGLDKS